MFALRLKNRNFLTYPKYVIRLLFQISHIEFSSLEIGGSHAISHV